MQNNNFKFNISLSVLNHLGRNLYRSFATVLGEAISNAWDADAHNVYIYLDQEKNTLCIKDDGVGMTTKDFQDKFLKIGYSKRTTGGYKSPQGRSYIGRKGIGKLALLSCAKKISIISKIEGAEYVGGMIDNTGLDKAIKDDVSSHDYALNNYDDSLFKQYKEGHNKGTIIYFEEIKDGINNSEDFLKKIIALYFRFSLLDSSFNIFLNDDKITLESLKVIADKTQFVWNINDFVDPYLSNFCVNVKKTIPMTMSKDFGGFIASVKKPKDRNIHSTGERVGVDLFVNGRLREADILKHIPSARVPESYLYGQIHFNTLDGSDVDPFTSSREGVLSDDERYKKFLKELKGVTSKIIDQWDELREKYKEDGDPENTRRTLKERKAGELANAVFEEFIPTEESGQKNKVDQWCGDLFEDAKFNFESYADCFVSENLVRKYISTKGMSLSPKQGVIDGYKTQETEGKRTSNLTIDIRQSNNEIFYLDMKDLVELAHVPNDGHPDTLLTDEKQFSVIRNALMHTAALTKEAKRKLTTVYDNIKGKIKNFLSQP